MRTRRPRTPWQAWRPLAALTAIALLAGFAAPVAAQDYAIANVVGPAEVKGAPSEKANSVPLRQDANLRSVPNAPLGQGYGGEVEPNGTSATANPLSGTRRRPGRATIFPNADVDWFSFTAAAGDKVYAAIMSGASSNGRLDSQMSLFESTASLNDRVRRRRRLLR